MNIPKGISVEEAITQGYIPGRGGDYALGWVMGQLARDLTLAREHAIIDLTLKEVSPPGN